MKTKVKQIMLAVMIVVAAANSVQAKETKSTVEPEKTVYKRIGLHADLSLSFSSFIEKQREWQGGDYKNEVTLPKLNLTVGYRFNSYITLDVNLWSVILLSTTEFAPKINFTNTRISPFASGSVGFAHALRIGPSEPNDHYDNTAIIYKATVGVDGHVSKHTNVFLSVSGLYNPEYDNDSDPDDQRSDLEKVLISPEIGFQWKF